MTNQTLQEILDTATPEDFAAFLKDRGFSLYNRRSAATCPWASYLNHKLGPGYIVGVGETYTQIFRADFFPVPGMKMKEQALHVLQHTGKNAWIQEFVGRVDSQYPPVIEGWEALRIVERIIEASKPKPVADNLALVRSYDFERWIKEVYAPTVGQSLVTSVQG